MSACTRPGKSWRARSRSSRKPCGPGITTAELDSIAEREIRAAGAVPSFLGYFGFPASICTSVNEQVVHGIPGKEQVLRAGDIISIDCGAILDGWHGDSALSVGVGPIDAADQALLDACEASMWAGIEQAVAGQRLGDVSHAIEESVLGAGGYGLIREYTGHGIGTEMHMDPVVRNLRAAGAGTAAAGRDGPGDRADDYPGGRQVTELDDGWTVITNDGSRAAHFEHTVAITAEGPWVLTAREEEKAATAHPRTCAAYSAAFRYLRRRRRARCRVTRDCAPRTRTGSGPRSCCVSITRWGG